LNGRAFNATISSINNQLPTMQPQLNPLLVMVCDNQAQAVNDGDARFGDTLGDATQALADDDSDNDAPLSLEPAGNAVTKDGKLTYRDHRQLIDKRVHLLGRCAWISVELTEHQVGAPWLLMTRCTNFDAPEGRIQK
jgi:hypothetical protein